MAGFKKVMLPLIFVNCCLSYSMKTISDIETHSSGEQIAYIAFIVVDQINTVVTISAVPRTFGIKYGYNIVCIVLISRILTMILVYFVPDEPMENFIFGLCSNILAFVICALF